MRTDATEDIMRQFWKLLLTTYIGRPITIPAEDLFERTAAHYSKDCFEAHINAEMVRWGLESEGKL
jgi:glycyl-tRNA synthetase (class II)